MRTVDAAKVSEIFEEEKRLTVSGMAYAALTSAQDRIAHLPDAGDPKPKRSAWVMRGHVPECQACEARAPMREVLGGWRCYHKTKHCPDCGARMENYDR